MNGLSDENAKCKEPRSMKEEACSVCIPTPRRLGLPKPSPTKPTSKQARPQRLAFLIKMKPHDLLAYTYLHMASKSWNDWRTQQQIPFSDKINGQHDL